ncbi:DnaD domain protein [Clostridium botulinum]|uniref:DnaD domain protein n=1 Tax=Clostridium botulinum TaxID=1491 RepID=UPI0006A5FE40|nr:DnaD domain protein [Clostridium botulinum]
MAVIRVIKNKENPYIMVNKYYIYDNRLSLKAKGLMSYFLSRPDNWEFYASEIKNHTTDKETAISSSIKELIKNGYIKRKAKRANDGKFQGGYNYEVYETPVELENSEFGIHRNKKTPNGENPKSGKSQTGEIPNGGNQGLVNNDLKVINDSKVINDLKVIKEREESPLSESQELLNYIENLASTTANITNIGLNKALKEHDHKYVRQAIDVALQNGRVDINYIYGILRNWKKAGYPKKSAVIKSNSKNEVDEFNNHPQRSYNFDELEKKLLGWEE